jgi:hypothetical protein
MTLSFTSPSISRKEQAVYHPPVKPTTEDFSTEHELHQFLIQQAVTYYAVTRHRGLKHAQWLGLDRVWDTSAPQGSEELKLSLRLELLRMYATE